MLVTVVKGKGKERRENRRGLPLDKNPHMLFKSPSLGNLAGSTPTGRLGVSSPADCREVINGGGCLGLSVATDLAVAGCWLYTSAPAGTYEAAGSGGMHSHEARSILKPTGDMLPSRVRVGEVSSASSLRCKALKAQKGGNRASAVMKLVSMA